MRFCPYKIPILVRAELSFTGMLYTSCIGNSNLDSDKAFLVQISNSSPGEFPLNFVLQEAFPSWRTVQLPQPKT